MHNDKLLRGCKNDAHASLFCFILYFHDNVKYLYLHQMTSDNYVYTAAFWSGVRLQISPKSCCVESGNPSIDLDREIHFMI